MTKLFFLRSGLIALAVCLVAGAGTAWYHKDLLQRVYLASTLFSGAEQYDRFGRIHELYDHTTVNPSESPRPFQTGKTLTLPVRFVHDSAEQDTEQFLDDTDTVALLVLHKGRLVHESYRLTGGEDVTWLSWSMAKSVIATLFGIAVDEGKIASLDETVTDYLPDFKGTAYDGVKLKDVLQMSSGASWVEDYSDPDSDINRFAKTFAFGKSFTDFAKTLAPAREPGRYKLYNSVDTQVLGLVLAAATGETVTDYMQSRLWSPLGAEHKAYWIVDSDGVEMSFGGLNATARDYAKIGQLYLDRGRVGDKQLVSEDWIADATHPDAAHLAYRAELTADAPSGYGQDLGYGYQWWVLNGAATEFAAMGIYNMFIFVDRESEAVIVKLSANSHYGLSMDAETSQEPQSFSFFRSIVDTLEQPALDFAQRR